MRRTLYLSMVCLLSALSVVGQTGSRDLNPIEKQKLQLPELPGSQARASMLRSNESVDYTKGTFIVNEDWYGHQNSSVNFLSDDGTWTYNAFQRENPGHELGCTSQFGTIYGDLLYIVSKQSKDGAASVEGSRLAVIDAKTMQVKKEFQTINSAGADGRSFLGVDLTKGYMFFIQDTMKRPENMMKTRCLSRPAQSKERREFLPAICIIHRLEP